MENISFGYNGGQLSGEKAFGIVIILLCHVTRNSLLSLGMFAWKCFCNIRSYGLQFVRAGHVKLRYKHSFVRPHWPWLCCCHCNAMTAAC